MGKEGEVVEERFRGTELAREVRLVIGESMKYAIVEALSNSIPACVSWFLAYFR